MVKPLKIQLSPLINQPQQLGFSLRMLLAQEPAYQILYQPYIWWEQVERKIKGAEPKELCSDTELVIDGHQGSANSFVTTAFKRSQNRNVKLAHHLHSPAQIIKAVEKNIAVLLVIREPKATVLSLTSRWPYISVTQGLRSYVRFYTKLKPYSHNCVISTFEQSTQHLGQVIQRVNIVFNTNFDVVDVAKANTQRKEHQSKDPEGAARRKSFKQEKSKEFTTQENALLLSQANKLYQDFEAFTQKTVKL